MSPKRLDPHEARSVMEAAGLVPLEPYRNALAPWQCRCTRCKKVVTPTYNAVQQGKGCRSCAVRVAGEKRRLPGEAAAATMREAGAEPLVPYRHRTRSSP